MSDLSAAQGAQIEEDLGRAQAEPMPSDLRRAIASLIEPHTMNMQIKHRDVMECIDVAYPLIREFLHGHPDDSVPP
jgi:hypothetical protein